MRLFTFFISSLLLTSYSIISFAQSGKAGGQSGFDTSIAAIEPSEQAFGISLAGQTPIDISRYILAGNQGANSARISPDGKTLAFAWSITGVAQIWTIPVTGGQPKQLTFGNGVSFYRWSPDGQSLIYGADNDGNEQQAYYQISADGLQEKLLLQAAKGGFRAFGDFVDANHIAFASTERNQLDFDIYLANLKSKDTELVYKGEFGFFVSSASPDGRYLVLNETVGEDSDNLYLFDLTSKRIHTISKPERRANHSEGGIVWTSDSKGFYLSSNVARNFTALMYYTVDSGFSLVHEAQGDISGVMLCDRDRLLVWSENIGGYSHLYAKRLDTNQILNAPQLPQGVYRTTCSSQSNAVAIHVNGWDTPGDIYTWKVGKGQLYHSFVANLAGLNREDLVKPESVTMPARDGVQLQGLLYMPQSKPNSKTKPPVLFRVHGGPTAQSRPTFRATTQYLVSQGIAVFLPNVRGSTGFGHKYVTLDDRENRLDSIRDLVDMLTYLEKDGRVNTKKAAVAGGSYGGYAVNAVLANFPGHFIAGVSLYGVADWVTALQVASPALKAADRIEYGDITEQKWLDYYTEQSPIRQADNIDVPVLFSHGVMDPRIDIVETEIMVTTLRKNGIEAPFIRIPDEGHGWRKLKNQQFYAREEAKFLLRQFDIKP